MQQSTTELQFFTIFFKMHDFVSKWGGGGDGVLIPFNSFFNNEMRQFKFFFKGLEKSRCELATTGEQGKYLDLYAMQYTLKTGKQ